MKLVEFLERLMAKNKINVDDLRRTLTTQNPIGLKLDVKTLLEVKDALDYIERKEQAQDVISYVTTLVNQLTQQNSNTR